MKFIDLLDSIEEFDGELIVADLYESKYGFVWIKPVEFTDDGKKKFHQILQSEVIIHNDIIILQDKSILENDYDLFMRTMAGNISCSIYDGWVRHV